MDFRTTIAYHDAFFEVELVLPYTFATKSEAEKVGNGPSLTDAMLHPDKIVVGKGKERFTINKQDTSLYQFRVCPLSQEELERKALMVSYEDYDNISWEEAVAYLYKTYEHAPLPFSLESYYYAVYENEVVFT